MFPHLPCFYLPLNSHLDSLTSNSLCFDENGSANPPLTSTWMAFFSKLVTYPFNSHQQPLLSHQTASRFFHSFLGLRHFPLCFKTPSNAPSFLQTKAILTKVQVLVSIVRESPVSRSSSKHSMPLKHLSSWDCVFSGQCFELSIGSEWEHHSHDVKNDVGHYDDPRDEDRRVRVVELHLDRVSELKHKDNRLENHENDVNGSLAKVKRAPATTKDNGTKEVSECCGHREELDDAENQVDDHEELHLDLHVAGSLVGRLHFRRTAHVLHVIHLTSPENLNIFKEAFINQKQMEFLGAQSLWKIHILIWNGFIAVDSLHCHWVRFDPNHWSFREEREEALWLRFSEDFVSFMDFPLQN